MRKVILAVVAISMMATAGTAAYALDKSKLPNIVTAGKCPVHMVPMDKCPQGMMHP